MIKKRIVINNSYITIFFLILILIFYFGYRKKEIIVANDQVAALSDKAWLLFCEVVFRIIKGKEQTLKNIIAIPQERNES